MTIRAVLAFVRLGRPQFLVGGVVLHGLGIAVALYTGAPLNVPALLLGQLAITAIQWMTHYANDYFDLEADRANTSPSRWSGGSRVLPEGGIASGVALKTAYTLLWVAVLAAGMLTVFIRPNGLTPALFGAALVGAWCYSAPPVHLHSRGLGEVTSALLVAGLTPLVGFYLQTGRLALLPILAALPLCGFQFTMLLAVEFPDIAGDAQVGKRTLVVRLGLGRTGWLYAAALLAAYGALPAAVALGLPLPVGLAVLLMAPLALVQAWRLERCIRNPAAANWSSFAFWNIALLMGTAAAEALALVLLVGTR